MDSETFVSGLKICFIAHCLKKGGSEKQLYYWIKTLKEKGAKIIVLSLTKQDYFEKKIEELGIRVFCIHKLLPLADILKARKIIQEFKPQIVQSTHVQTNILAQASSLFLGAKAIGAIRGNVKDEIKKTGLGKFSIRFPKTKIVNSKTILKELKKEGIDSSNTYYLQNAIGEEYFCKGKKQKNALPLILNVANFKQQKNQIVLLEALAILKQNDCLFRAKIVGSINESNIFEKLKEKAMELGLEKDAKIILFNGDIKRFFCEADLFALSSESEGMPNVVLEAMAASLPIVSTNVGDVKLWIKNNKNGFVVEKNNPFAFAEKLCFLVKKTHIARIMGQKNTELAAKEFSTKKLEKELVEIYYSIGEKE
jgi:glycosyltransferase involved in cell wall biosynthesis